ncbi:MAG: hypothetical protein HYW25_00930 [Candidatus Aenigmarchaeota archaeon]|nr:hypothetical protein [Candidatus Aenigmarchaeota archaeon]
MHVERIEPERFRGRRILLGAAAVVAALWTAGFASEIYSGWRRNRTPPPALPAMETADSVPEVAEARQHFECADIVIDEFSSALIHRERLFPEALSEGNLYEALTSKEVKEAVEHAELQLEMAAARNFHIQHRSQGNRGICGQVCLDMLGYDGLKFYPEGTFAYVYPFPSAMEVEYSSMSDPMEKRRENFRKYFPVPLFCGVRVRVAVGEPDVPAYNHGIVRYKDKVFDPGRGVFSAEDYLKLEEIEALSNECWFVMPQIPYSERTSNPCGGELPHKFSILYNPYREIWDSYSDDSTSQARLHDAR